MIKNEYDEQMRKLFFNVLDANDRMFKCIVKTASAKKMFELLPSPQVKEYLETVREELSQTIAEYEDAAHEADSYLKETKAQRYTTLDYQSPASAMEAFALNISRLK